MKYRWQHRGRRSLRLPGFDYAQSGVYFVTICTADRRCLFGDVIGEQIQLNLLGKIVEEEWQRSALIREEIRLDAWVVMPNHIHALLILNPSVGAYGHTPLQTNSSVVGAYGDTPHADHSLVIGAYKDTAQPNDSLVVGAHGHTPLPKSPSRTLGAMVRAFKGACTSRARDLLAMHGGRLWQRNYYEHIVRDAKALFRLRQYIKNNPARWQTDPENIQAKQGS